MAGAGWSSCSVGERGLAGGGWIRLHERRPACCPVGTAADCCLWAPCGPAAPHPRSLPSPAPAPRPAPPTLCRFNARANNKGWRLDHFLVSQALHGQVHECYHLPGVMGSDHCPLGLVVKL